MSQTKAHPEQESVKKHGDPLEQVNTVDHAAPVPPGENGGHDHSPAAHLESQGKPNTKPAGNLRQGSHPEALREPPTVVQRVGKQHK